MQNDTPSKGVLSHFELVHRPGERENAVALFDALGLRVVESGPYVMGFIGPAANGNSVENMIAASEITPEHWEFEQVLDRELRRPEIASLSETYKEALKARPQNRPHFGFAYDSYEEWAGTLERIEKAVEERPELKGRARLASKFVPGGPGAQTDYLHHAFIHTDIVGTGCLSLGTIIELQYYARHPY